MSEKTSAETYLMYQATAVTAQSDGSYQLPTSGTWTKLCDITNYPDLMSPAEKLDSTTLSNLTRTYEPDIKDTNDLSFEANYDMATYKKIAGLRNGVYAFKVLFGAETSSGFFGSWSWVGKVDVTPNGAGVSEIRHMTITMYPKTDIEEGLTAPSSSGSGG